MNSFYLFLLENRTKYGFQRKSTLKSVSFLYAIKTLRFPLQIGANSIK